MSLPTTPIARDRGVSLNRDASTEFLLLITPVAGCGKKTMTRTLRHLQ